MQGHSTSEGSTKLLGSELIVSRMEGVCKLAWKYAGESVEKFEELYSIGLVAMCEAAAHVPEDCVNPQGYVYKAAEYRMIDEVNRRYAYRTVSLDAPLKADGSFSLGDLLPDSSPVVSQPSKRVRALNGAIRRLRSTQRRGVLRRRYALAGYGACDLAETAHALHTTVANVDTQRSRGLGDLRKDVRLCKVMGVEVPVKQVKPAAYGASDRLRGLLAENPDRSPTELARLVGCSRSTASIARKQYLEAHLVGVAQ